MQSILKLIAWIVIFILVALLLFFATKLLMHKERKSVVEPSSIQSISPDTVPVPTTTLSQKQPPELLKPISPISISATENTSESSSVEENDQEKAKRKRVLSEVREKLQVLMQSPNSISPSEVDAVLSDMNVLKDEKGLVGGVNLDVLRETLKISDEMQRLAMDIKAESELGEQANSQRLLEQSQQMEVLKQKLIEASDSKRLIPES